MGLIEFKPDTSTYDKAYEAAFDDAVMAIEEMYSEDDAKKIINEFVGELMARVDSVDDDNTNAFAKHIRHHYAREYAQHVTGEWYPDYK